MTAAAVQVPVSPILFSGDMVRAILDGRKTQTRRVIKPQPKGEPRPLSEWSVGIANACGDHSPDPAKLARHSAMLAGQIFPFANAEGRLHSPACPYGSPGCRLWVRETCLRMRTEVGSLGGNPELDEFMYADHDDYDVCYPSKSDAIDLGWRVCPSIFMPRVASRLTLELTDVRVERVQSISEEDCRAEGCAGGHDSIPDYNFSATPREHFHHVWDSINAKRNGGAFAWARNPFVWCLTFRKVDV